MRQIAAAVVVAAVSGPAAACTSQRVPAEQAAKAVQEAVARAQPEIQQFAGDQMGAINAGVEALQAKLSRGDYAGVLADAQALTAQVASAAQVAAAKKAEVASEWTSYASLPAMVGEATAKIAALAAARRLPAGMDKAALEGAKTSLDSVNRLWAEATAAYEKGDLLAAVAKAKEARPMLEGVMRALGLSAAS